MKTFATLVAALSVTVLAACSQPKAPEPVAADHTLVVEADVATRNALLTALTPVIEGDFGQTVNFRVEIVRTQGPWGWVAGAPLSATGGAIDFSKTKYAEQAKEGTLDGGGYIHALLHQDGGVWTVKAFDVGSTDVAWLEWPKTYGAPPEVMGFETAEGGE